MRCSTLYSTPMPVLPPLSAVRAFETTALWPPTYRHSALAQRVAVTERTNCGGVTSRLASDRTGFSFFPPSSNRADVRLR